MIIQEAFEHKVLVQSELEECINEQEEVSAPEVEIDSVSDDDFGELYRVWNGTQLIGTFYQNLEGKWVAQPCSNEKQICCETSDFAILIIVALNGLLVADVA
ncbi:MAG: hypothetical protein AAFX80_17775 [Cyanobacteria bacterium J06639_18]